MVLFTCEMLWSVRFIALVAKHITNQGSKSCAKARQKVWTRTKILSPNLRYFATI